MFRDNKGLARRSLGKAGKIAVAVAIVMGALVSLRHEVYAAPLVNPIRIPFSESIPNFCPDSTNPSQVTLSGFEDIVQAGNNNGQTIFIVNTHLKGSDTNGTNYVDNETVQAVSTPNTGIYDSRSRLTATGPTKTVSSMIFDQQFHVVNQPDGSVKVVVDKQDFECK